MSKVKSSILLNQKNFCLGTLFNKNFAKVKPCICLTYVNNKLKILSILKLYIFLFSLYPIVILFGYSDVIMKILIIYILDKLLLTK